MSQHSRLRVEIKSVLRVQGLRYKYPCRMTHADTSTTLSFDQNLELKFQFRFRPELKKPETFGLASGASHDC